MALTAIFTKQGRNLIADERITIEGMEKIKNGQQVKAIVTVPRNLQQHRLLFALLNLVIQGQPEPAIYPTTESLLTALKYATGHVHEVKDMNGVIHLIPKSISFAELDQVDFAEWWDKAINIICTRILPHCNRADLEREIYRALGEITPDEYAARR